MYNSVVIYVKITESVRPRWSAISCNIIVVWRFVYRNRIDDHTAANSDRQNECVQQSECLPLHSKKNASLMGSESNNDT